MGFSGLGDGRPCLPFGVAKNRQRLVPKHSESAQSAVPSPSLSTPSPQSPSVFLPTRQMQPMPHARDQKEGKASGSSKGTGRSAGVNAGTSENWGGRDTGGSFS